MCKTEITNEWYGENICATCYKDLSVKKYKHKDIMAYKSHEDIDFIISHLSVEDLFT